MRRLVLIIITLAFCLPAQAEILIFQTSTRGKQLDIENKIVEKKNERGYLLIDADLTNPDSVTVSKAYYLHYEKKDGNKIQNTTIPADVELILVNYGKNKMMVLRWFDDVIGTYTVVYGTAKLKDIGSSQQYVASSLSGHEVWKQPDFRTGSASVKLRLDIKATKTANTQSRTAVDIIEEYSQALELKGYSVEM